MELSKRVAGGAVTLAVAALPFATDIPRAGAANSFYEDRNAAQLEYENADGQKVHCSVTGYSALVGPDGDYFGRSETATFDGSYGDGCRASLRVEVTYVDTSGIRRTGVAFGLGTNVTLDSFDIASGYTATHSVDLLDCRPSSESDCSATFTTQPK